MTLKDLTIRLKKSVTGLFSPPFYPNDTSVVEATELSTTETHVRTPDLEDFGSDGHHTNHSCPNFKMDPRSNDSPSKRNRLIGTLRKGSLRSLSSLRSLRSSPSKLKEHDGPYIAVQKVHSEKPSLILNFEESPLGQPIFELPVRTSRSSSLSVHHSSPLNIPSSLSKVRATCNLSRPPVPAGTVPTSPTPLQMALEMDRDNDAPSSPNSPIVATSTLMKPLPTPMPGTNLAFEDLQPVGANVQTDANMVETSYFDIPYPLHHQPKLDSLQDNHDAPPETGIKATVKRSSSFDDSAYISSSAENCESTGDHSSTSQSPFDRRNQRQSHRADEKSLRPYKTTSDRRSDSGSSGSVLSIPTETRLLWEARSASKWNTNPALYDGSGYGTPLYRGNSLSSRSSCNMDSTSAMPYCLGVWPNAMEPVPPLEHQPTPAMDPSVDVASVKEKSSKADFVPSVEAHHDDAEMSTISQEQSHYEESLELIYGAYAGLEETEESHETAIESTVEEAETEVELANEVMDVSLGA